MTKIEALRLLIAASDDPVLAAWAAVIHEHKMPPDCDVSPYDYLEAYQTFFSHGLITSVQYDNTDTSRIFFSGRRPPAREVQRVLDNLRILPEHQPLEPPRMKTKLPENPFASSTTLTARDSGSLVNGGRAAAELPARQAAAALNPFSNSREVLPKNKEAISLGDLPSRAVQRIGPKDEQIAQIGEHAIEADVRCCGRRLEMVVDGGQVIGPDDMPGGQVSVIDAVFHGRCAECQTVWHCSAGKTIPQEAFR